MAIKKDYKYFMKDYKYFMKKHFSVKAIGLIALVIFTHELLHL